MGVLLVSASASYRHDERGGCRIDTGLQTVVRPVRSRAAPVRGPSAGVVRPDDGLVDAAVALGHPDPVLRTVTTSPVSRVTVCVFPSTEVLGVPAVPMPPGPAVAEPPGRAVSVVAVTAMANSHRVFLSMMLLV
ncbi:hypothetical protein [Micromonospora zamorensis]|uniref:hypothetical protein n=1 Tax=Micromonospora zamorensis TaxID=709883 RepID=UPI003CF6BFA8